MRVTLRLTSLRDRSRHRGQVGHRYQGAGRLHGRHAAHDENGTFIINGTERVIVSQMHRSPGVLFDHDRGKTHASGKYLFAARVIPYRGSWLDFEFDAKDIVNVRIDRKRKLPVTALLHALGLTSEEILNEFYNRVVYVRGPTAGRSPTSPSNWRGQKPMYDVVNADTGEVVFKAGEKITPRRANQAAKEGLAEPHHPDRGNLRPLLGL
jgi:DNA-directed RNA polymerase subunit beta